MKQTRKLIGMISLALLPQVVSAQIYQDVSNTTATVVRDPARQASTEVDAVLFNPAGTALINEGLHLSLSGRLAYQNFDLGDNYNSMGKSTRDVIPSLQAVYKKGALALSFSVGNEGGYGQWNMSEDVMLSHVLTNVCNQAFDKYKDILSGFANSCNQYDQLVSKAMVSGGLYNYTTRIGAAYQINKNLSAYAGLRVNYVTEKTNIGITRWVAKANGGIETANSYFNAVDADFKKTMQDIKEPYEQLVEIGNLLGVDVSNVQEYVELCNLLTDVMGNYNKEIAETPYGTYLLNERTSGWGISPVIGLDYQVGQFNFAAKYEFETKIHANGNSPSYHIPSVLSLGASWQIKDNLKVSVGGSLYHQSDKLYGRSQVTDLSDKNLYFNMGSADASQTSFSVSDNKLTSGDISASVSFSPVKRLMFSVGYTYASQSPIFKSIYLQSCPMAKNMQMDIISGGIRYDISDNVQLDLGISKKTATEDYHNHKANMSLYGLNGVNVSAGININL